MPKADTSDEIDEDLKKIAVGAAAKVEEQMDQVCLQHGAGGDLGSSCAGPTNISTKRLRGCWPRTRAERPELDTVMHNLRSDQIISILIYPFMHSTSKEIRKQLGLWYADVEWKDAFVFEMMGGEQVKKGPQLFPRLDIEKELAELAAVHQQMKRLRKRKKPPPRRPSLRALSRESRR